MKVVNLELSKRMDELGFKGDSEWYWAKFNKVKKYQSGGDTCVKNRCKWKIIHKSSVVGKNRIHAYNATELGEILPLSHDCYTVKTPDGKWICDWNDGYDEPTFKTMTADNEANARAKTAIYLREQKLI